MPTSPGVHSRRALPNSLVLSCEIRTPTTQWMSTMFGTRTFLVGMYVGESNDNKPGVLNCGAIRGFCTYPQGTCRPLVEVRRSGRRRPPDPDAVSQQDCYFVPVRP